MNIGRFSEAVLGRRKELGVKFATPIFDGASMDDLNEWTDKAGLPRYCKTYLCDGGTGRTLDQPATVGNLYVGNQGTWLKIRCMPVLSVRTPYYPAAALVRHSSVVSVSEKWKFGRIVIRRSTYLTGNPDH